MHRVWSIQVRPISILNFWVDEVRSGVVLQLQVVDRLEKDGVGVLIDKFRTMATEAGRDLAGLPITIFRVPEDIARLRFCRDIGIDRVTFSLPPEQSDVILPILDRWADLQRQLAQ